jgi:hypothetical protein
MEDKKLYSPEEVAQIAEAWRKVGESDDSIKMGNLKKYEKLVPLSVQNAITYLRDIEYGYYKKTPEQRKSIGDLEKWFTGFGKFKEFFKIFD